MKLETIILSKLTQEQKTKHCVFSLIGGCSTMRTHGHREGSITHWGLLVGPGEGQQGGVEVREGYHGEKCQIYMMGGWQQQTALPDLKIHEVILNAYY